MFKNKIAVYAFMGAVCAMFLAQPAFADTAKKIDMPPYILRFSLDDISHPPVELIFIQIT